MTAKPAPPPTWKWIRVRDKSTGHEYDIAPSALDERAHEPLGTGHNDRDPRPAKHNTGPAGLSVTMKES